MKTYIKYIASLVLILGLFSCTTSETAPTEEENDHGHDHITNEVHLTPQKFKSLKIELDTMQHHTFEGIVQTNGSLEVPPQHEATITAILGGNVVSIEVIEGENVKKGQTLAYLSHPNFINIQTAYLKAFHNDAYLSKQFDRQTKLSEAEIGAGKDMQKSKSEYLSNKGEMNGYAAQLKQLNLNLNYIQEGNLYDRIPVKSPINGSIEAVDIQIGQYMEQQTTMFKIVNTEHLHADFMVFEKDVMFVKEGQKIEFTVATSNQPLTAEIISVGKRFEEAPRAVHIHAEIEEKDINLVAGMYIKGKIFTQANEVMALPESAVITEDGKTYIFITTQSEEKREKEFEFQMIEVKTGKQEDGWIAIDLLSPLPENAKIVQNDAYYLIAEMLKGETAHEH
ncbi:efflux RND transporter periplasmic adaptor subunit [Brumimicrobium aurantiacum]|uniref:Efflux RND transporter periplasmic adaptor subunit n=1 Tax=Brumimicrobium aurantiacum TaxID=1737063 RepID=A0A3E1EVN3_9FLAO|nr:efflux RND transporter periplasmic adaptor subunit [Brumimicrobium aurantiacum]RFC53626.1 efflux RND transporter periplasmic adaptor subunit [Brumimicrobium aurantiacum]